MLNAVRLSLMAHGYLAALASDACVPCCACCASCVRFSRCARCVVLRRVRAVATLAAAWQEDSDIGQLAWAAVQVNTIPHTLSIQLQRAREQMCQSVRNRWEGEGSEWGAWVRLCGMQKSRKCGAGSLDLDICGAVGAG